MIKQNLPVGLKNKNYLNVEANLLESGKMQNTDTGYITDAGTGTDNTCKVSNCSGNVTVHLQFPRYQ